MLRLAAVLGLCLAAGARADTQVLVMKIKQKPIFAYERLTTSTWGAVTTPQAGFLVVEVGAAGAIQSAKVLWYWTAGTKRVYDVADPTTQGIGFLRLKDSARALLWKDDRVRVACYGSASSSTVYVANAYNGVSADVREEEVGGTLRVTAVAASALGFRLDKGLSTQANAVHNVDAFVAVLKAGLETQGYVDVNAKGP
jgi:hypothetical protein